MITRKQRVVTETHAKHSKELGIRGESPLARGTLRFTVAADRWLPDAFGFALAATVVVFVLGYAAGEPLFRTPRNTGGAAAPGVVTGYGLVEAWGRGLWSLNGLALQLALVVVLGYAVATSNPVARVIARLGRIPRTPRTAVVFVAGVAVLTAYLNWAFGLVFTAMLAREVARNLPTADYRALGAMAFLGIGTIWAHADPGAGPLTVLAGTVPMADTVFGWRSLLATLVVFAVAVTMAWLIVPGGSNARSADDLGIEFRPLVGRGSHHNGDLRRGAAQTAQTARTRRPGDFADRSPVLPVVVAVLVAAYLIRHHTAGDLIGSPDLDAVNLVLLGLALVLHVRPWRLARAAGEGARPLGMVLLPFPLYGGITGMIALSGLAARMPDRLAGITAQVLVTPLLVLPTLALLGLRTRDVMTYALAMFVACLPAAVLAVTVLVPRVTS